MARGKVRVYDDDALVEMIARGNLTQVQIARAMGLSRAYVGKIVRGERRRRLQRRIKAAREGKVDHARRMGAKWSRALLAQHIKIGMAGEDEIARKCREFTLTECCFNVKKR